MFNVPTISLTRAFGLIFQWRNRIQAAKSTHDYLSQGAAILPRTVYSARWCHFQSTATWSPPEMTKKIFFNIQLDFAASFFYIFHKHDINHKMFITGGAALSISWNRIPLTCRFGLWAEIEVTEIGNEVLSWERQRRKGKQKSSAYIIPPPPPTPPTTTSKLWAGFCGFPTYRSSKMPS